MRVARAQKVIGVAVPASEMADIFSRLGLAQVRETAARVTLSWSRRLRSASTSQIEEDLIEEIARIYGFERIPARPPRAPLSMRPQRETRRSPHACASSSPTRDYHEVINFSFVDAQWESDFASDQSHPRPQSDRKPARGHAQHASSAVSSRT